MTREEATEWVVEMLAEQLGVAHDSIKSNTTLEDLGATDDDLEKLAGFIQDDFGFEVDAEASLIYKDDLNVGDVINLVENGGKD